MSGKAARVAYTPATPDPENAKALKLPFAAQMHITVPGQEAAYQYLLVRTKPPGLNRKVHNLWPSGIQVSYLCDCETHLEVLHLLCAKYIVCSGVR